MGTRGLCGFVVDGEVRSSYNHFDSYPSGLGADIVEQIGVLSGKFNEKELKQKVRDIFFVDEGSEVTPEYIEKYKEYYNELVGGSKEVTWYQLLRDAQGDLVANVNAGVMIDGNGFAKDSLFCEWGYLVNLDTKKLEVYRGFQKKSHVDGRFADMEDEGEETVGGHRYYPIRLVAEFPFDELPDMRTWEDEFYESEEADEDDYARA